MIGSVTDDDFHIGGIKQQPFRCSSLWIVMEPRRSIEGAYAITPVHRTVGGHPIQKPMFADEKQASKPRRTKVPDKPIILNDHPRGQCLGKNVCGDIVV